MSYVPYSAVPSDLYQIVDPYPLILSSQISVQQAIAQMGQLRGDACTIHEDQAGQARTVRSSSCALIVEADRLVGIFTERDVVRLVARELNLHDQSIAEVMTRNVITLPQAELQDLFSVLIRMQAHGIRHLPIVDPQQRPIGLVSQDSIRQALRPENLLRLRQVCEVMTSEVIHTAPSLTLLEITQLMASHSTSCIVLATPIAAPPHPSQETASAPSSPPTPQAVQPIGILTERDILQFQLLELDFATTPAQAVMSTPLVCLQPTDSLWLVQQEMQRRRVRRLVVTGDRGELLGLVTQTSLLRIFDPAEMNWTISLLQQEVQAKTHQLQQVNQRLEAEVIQRRQSESALRQAQLELEGRVADRTAALTAINQQLQQEILDRQQAETTIRQQATLLDEATDAIFVRDLGGQILYWNRGAERIYGWPAPAAIGQSANRLLYRDLTQLEDPLTQTIDAGSWHGELHKITQSGQEIVVESRWTLVRDEAGNPQRILTVDTDITERKLLEAQFLRVQRLESLGTLASGIAHDLNNILTPVLAVSQLLPQKLAPIDEQTQRLLTILRESAQRGTALVAQILSFARGSEGQRTLIQVGHLLYETVRIARQTFPKSIEVVASFASRELWMVLADATQLHQVFMNLTVNARDAMPDGGTLTIAADNVILDDNYAHMHPEAKPGSYVAVTIEDTGVGIAPELLDQVFEAFFTTKEVGKGTGLGLSTAQGIVRRHGGFMRVCSEVGKGSRFTVYLPSASEDVELEPSPSLESLRGQGELVLVVDDEASIREITKATLEAHHYRVLTATDGIDAIALYAEYKREVFAVLLDLMMPLMEAPMVIRTLSKLNPRVAIVTMSGFVPSESPPSVQTANVRSFLAKPFTAQDLLQTLHHLRQTD